MKFKLLTKILFSDFNYSTLISLRPLSKLYKLVEKVQLINGSIVECGVQTGHSASTLILANEKTMMKQPFSLEKKNVGEKEINIGRKRVWLFDSFEGCPEPSEYDINYHGRKGVLGECAIEESWTRNFLFNTLKLPECNITIVKGWFKDTLPKYKEEVGSISFLHVDGDWYSSTKEIFESFYDNVVLGGIIVIDDYKSWFGCKKATDEFFEKRNISPKLIPLNFTSHYFIKGEDKKGLD